MHIESLEPTSTSHLHQTNLASFVVTMNDIQYPVPTKEHIMPKKLGTQDGMKTLSNVTLIRTVHEQDSVKHN